VTIHPIPRLPRSRVRAVAYLEVDGNDEVNVARVLRRIDSARHRDGEKERNKVAFAMRHWLSGRRDDHLHHGWETDEKFKNGYVFKWDHQHQHRRLYGFVTKPRPFLEVCVLCCFRAKRTYKTDEEAKRIVRTMIEHPEVKQAVQIAFGQERRESWQIH